MTLSILDTSLSVCLDYSVLQCDARSDAALDNLLRTRHPFGTYTI